MIFHCNKALIDYVAVNVILLPNDSLGIYVFNKQDVLTPFVNLLQITELGQQSQTPDATMLTVM